MSAKLKFDSNELHTVEKHLIEWYGVSMPTYLGMQMIIRQRVKQLYDSICDRLSKSEYYSGLHTGPDDESGGGYVETVINLHDDDLSNKRQIYCTIKLNSEYKITFSIDFTHYCDKTLCMTSTQDMDITADCYRNDEHYWDVFCKICMTAVDSIVDVCNSIRKTQ